MKLIHLADLHLGKSLLEAPLLDEQAAFLHWVLETAKQEQADAVVIAGDIYDRAVPPASAVEALNRFLEEANRQGIPVLAISGNHDSPERLDFLSGVLSAQGIHIAGIYSGQVPKVVLRDEKGPVNFYLLPFLRPVFVRQALDCPAETTDEAVRLALQGLPENPGERNVLVAHQFVCAGGQQPETCESETLSVGGSDQVDASAFQGFDYVALGHLHRGQRVGSETVRYAGSPLKYSLSEVNHQKSVPLVTLGDKGEVDIRLLRVTPRRDLRRIQGDLEALMDAGREETEGREDYIWAVLTGEPGLDPAERLRLLYPNLLHVETVPTETAQPQDEGELEAADVQRDTAALFGDFFAAMTGHSLSDDQRGIVQETAERLRDRGGEE